MNETVTVTLSARDYDRVLRLARLRRQSVGDVLADLAAQPAFQIERTPGVQGGEACIVGTRVPVWVLAAMHRRGDTAEEIMEAYPNLTAAQIHAALSYYYDHRDEIDAVIAVQNATHQRIRER